MCSVEPRERKEKKEEIGLHVIIASRIYARR